MTRRRALTLGRAVDQYEASLRLLGRRPRGVETYRGVLDLMLDIVGTDIDARTLEHSDLLDVVTTWISLSPTTIAQRVSVLRSFGAWLEEEHDVPDPSARLKRPKKSRPARPRPDRSEMQSLIAAATGRDRIVVWLLAMTGARVSEALAIQWRDVEPGRILIRDGKGGKGRIVPIPKVLDQLLADERARRSEQGYAYPEHYVLCSWKEHSTPGGGHALVVHPERPAGDATPFKTLRRICAAHRLTPVSPHQLRRAYADAYLRANPGDLVGLQAVLGHESITTTRDYLAGVELERVAESVARVDFVTPPATNQVTPIRFPPPADESPWKTRRVEAAGIEPALPAADGSSPSPDEPSAPLVTGSTPDIVTPVEGVREEGS